MIEQRSIDRTQQFPSDDRATGLSGRAPAVTSALRILKFLAFERAEAGVSELARCLGLNKSTCFNILGALVQGQLLVKDDVRATYRLGPGVVELGTASRRNFSRRALYRRVLQPLVEEAGITCLVSQPLGDYSGLIVVDRVLPARGRDDIVTAPVGQRYPITAPAMGRAVLSHLDEHEAAEILRVVGRDQAADWVHRNIEALRTIRGQGYATSLEEYEPGVNAVATCVHGRRGEIVAVICLIGAVRELPRENLSRWGGRLGMAARAMESGIGPGDALGEEPE